VRLGLVAEEPWLDDARLADELGFDLVWIEAPLAVAAAAGAATTSIRIVAAPHASLDAIALAEEAAVADLATAGRLVLCVDATADVELLHDAFAGRPVERNGMRFRVTPLPAQLDLPVWIGPAADGAVTGRNRSIAVRAVSTGFDPVELAAELRSAGLDVAVLRLTGPGRREAIERIVRLVRPRLLLEDVSPGLDAYWRSLG
jgi:hypothetical protein